MLTIRAITNGQGYDARHLANNDYYAEGERVTGRWFGRGAALLGLAGDVRHEQFESIRQCLDPTTGEFLRERHSADRVAADGTAQSKARHFYDFTFSAPKSVSIVAQLTGDDRLVEAHHRAVEEALAELEVHASARVRQHDANEDRTTGNLVVAVYHHDTSRELDPQLHAHAVAGNLTYDEAEGRWKALQAGDIYERRAYLSEVYRNALAREVLQLGYPIEDRRDSKGNDAGFEIQGVSKELCDRYSQRSQQRDAAIAEFVAQKGRTPTDNEIAVLVRETRAEKLTEISTAEVKRRQRERLLPEESQTLGEVCRCGDALSVESPRSEHSAAASLQRAEEHIFERLSVAPDYELFSEALRHGRGRIHLSDLKGALRFQEQSGQALRSRHDIATHASLERERETIDTINRGLGAFERLGSLRFTPADGLREEQRHAIEFIFGSHDRAVNLRGAAGTGKTATLREIHRGLVEAGREVLATAPTMSAVEELQKVGFASAVTIDRLVKDRQFQVEAAGKVVIVDEAGLVSGRQMWELLKTAEHHSMRIIFSGDTRQIHSVEASDALRILERESRLSSTSLVQVQRQTVREYREAVEEFRRNPNHGFDKLEQIGAIREVHWEDRALAVQQAYADARSQPSSKVAPRTVLVVAATHDEIGMVTEAIRAYRKQAGELAEGVSVEHHVPRNFTAAQKKDPRHYRPGHLLIFHRRTKEIGKNEVLEVVRVEGRKTIARTEEGHERTITPKQAGAFDVFERCAVEIARGDQILLLGNRREKGFRATNGELATVSGLDVQGRIRLEDGRTLPPDYRQFSHGYAVTAHRSQGKTVDAVVIAADSMRRELFYVAASRGRESVAVVTTDREGLRKSVVQSDQRQSATELHRSVCRHGGGYHEVRSQRRGRQMAVKQARENARLATRETRAVVHGSLRGQVHIEQRPVSRDRQVKGAGYGL